MAQAAPGRALSQSGACERRVWGAARLLESYLTSTAGPSDGVCRQTVLEMGSGTGYLGSQLAIRPYAPLIVCCTETARFGNLAALVEHVAVMQDAADSAGCQLVAAECDWIEIGSSASIVNENHWSLLIGSDLYYSDETTVLFVGALAALLRQNHGARMLYAHMLYRWVRGHGPSTARLLTCPAALTLSAFNMLTQMIRSRHPPLQGASGFDARFLDELRRHRLSVRAIFVDVGPEHWLRAPSQSSSKLMPWDGYAVDAAVEIFKCRMRSSADALARGEAGPHVCRSPDRVGVVFEICLANEGASEAASEGSAAQLLRLAQVWEAVHADADKFADPDGALEAEMAAAFFAEAWGSREADATATGTVA